MLSVANDMVLVCQGVGFGQSIGRLAGLVFTVCCTAVGFDDRQAVQQVVHVLHAQPFSNHRQASPIKAAHAVGQQAIDAEGLAVGRRGLRGFAALVLVAALGCVQQGR